MNGAAPQASGAALRITVHSQHGHLPESLKEAVAVKMACLTKFLSTIDTIDVEIDKDGHDTFLVRAKVATSGPVFRSRVTSAEDPLGGVDVAVERLSRRLKEFKRLRSGRPLHSRPKAAPPMQEEMPVADLSGVLDGDAGDS
ncbi:MAG TPA: HPF/RaiA family ribosome-associated protein [Isosphaeraceae bacterium]|nr:HPF/RaiA family ribosome-associated protein [Isosphaeraceae bacterium]